MYFRRDGDRSTIVAYRCPVHRFKRSDGFDDVSAVRVLRQPHGGQFSVDVIIAVLDGNQRNVLR